MSVTSAPRDDSAMAAQVVAQSLVLVRDRDTKVAIAEGSGIA